MRLTTVILILCTLLSALAFKPMRDYIPNGRNVPNPCDLNAIWEGVGHTYPDGGGNRNPFGLDFARLGKRWTQQLCRLDSDGDGMSNGEELGDPNCVWRRGQKPTRSNVTHPGICDPMDSPECHRKNNWLTCKKTHFKCDATQEPEVLSFQMKFPRLNVPAEKTTYICMIVETPKDKDYHIIANEPILDNADILHHILLYGCTDTGPYGPITQEVNTPFECGMGAVLQCMSDLIGIWAKGIDGECMDPNAGFRIGPNGYKKLAVQMHWTNPQKLNDLFDASGLNLFVTPKLRPNDAGILWVGQSYLEIPPGKEKFESKGVCTQECTSAMLNTDINIFGAFSHMHYLGNGQTVKQYRDGMFVRTITDTMNYRYDNPTVQKFPDPVVVKSGDQLTVSCFYNSSSRTSVTLGGESSTEEMCISFLKYYPKESIPMPMCMNFKNLSLCKTSTRYSKSFPDLLEGCDVKDFARLTSPVAINMVLKVKSKCNPYFCIESCKTAVKEVRRNPCLKGDVFGYIKFLFLFKKDSIKALDMDRFMLAYTSCDSDIALEEGIQIGEQRIRELMAKQTTAAPPPTLPPKTSTTIQPVPLTTEKDSESSLPVCTNLQLSANTNGASIKRPFLLIPTVSTVLSYLLLFV